MLDFALDTVIVFGFGYVVFGLAAHLAYRWQNPKGAIVPIVAEVVAIEAEQPVAEQQPTVDRVEAEPVAEAVEVADVQPSRPTRRHLLALAKAARVPNYSRMSSDALADALLNVRAIAS